MLSQAHQGTDAPYQQQDLQTHLSLPYLRLFAGLIALAMSFFFSYGFIFTTTQSFGVALGFVIVTEFAKTLFTMDILIYVSNGEGDKAIFSGIGIFLLFALSISATVFVLQSNPSSELVRLSEIEKKIVESDNEIALKREQLDNCNPSYMTKCVNPRTLELELLLQSKSSLGLELKDFETIKSNKENWENLGEKIGISGLDLQMYFALIRAFILEILGLVLVSQSSNFLSGKVTQKTTFNALRNEHDSLSQNHNAMRGNLAYQGIDENIAMRNENNSPSSDPEIKELLVQLLSQTKVVDSHDDMAEKIEENNDDGLRQCERCSKDYIPNVTWQKFCGSECKNSQTVVKDNKNEK